MIFILNLVTSMKDPNRQRKTEIKAISAVQLNEEQKEAKKLIVENQIVVVKNSNQRQKLRPDSLLSKHRQTLHEQYQKTYL